MKHIMDKRNNESMLSFPDDEEVIFTTDPLGGEVIRLPGLGHKKEIIHFAGGRTATYLGGMEFSDHELVKNAVLLKEKAGKFIETISDPNDDKKTIDISYSFDESSKKFTEVVS